MKITLYIKGYMKYTITYFENIWHKIIHKLGEIILKISTKLLTNQLSKILQQSVLLIILILNDIVQKFKTNLILSKTEKQYLKQKHWRSFNLNAWFVLFETMATTSTECSTFHTSTVTFAWRLAHFFAFTCYKMFKRLWNTVQSA